MQFTLSLFLWYWRPVLPLLVTIWRWGVSVAIHCLFPLSLEDTMLQIIFPSSANSPMYSFICWTTNLSSILSHSSEGWKSKIKVLAGWVPSQKESVLCLTPSLWWFARRLWLSLACRCLTQSLPSSPGSLLVCISVSRFSLLIRTLGCTEMKLQLDFVSKHCLPVRSHSQVRMSSSFMGMQFNPWQLPCFPPEPFSLFLIISICFSSDLGITEFFKCVFSHQCGEGDGAGPSYYWFYPTVFCLLPSSPILEFYARICLICMLLVDISFLFSLSSVSGRNFSQKVSKCRPKPEVPVLQL